MDPLRCFSQTVSASMRPHCSRTAAACDCWAMRVALGTSAVSGHCSGRMAVVSGTGRSLSLSRRPASAWVAFAAGGVSYRPIVGHLFSPIGCQAFSPEWGPPVFGR